METKLLFTDSELKKYMNIALIQANYAKDKGEVPIGAMVLDNSTKEVIGIGYNEREEKQDAILHAEINAIQMACKQKESWRLEDTTLFVTLEPCPMCAGAIINSRIPNVVYGAKDIKAGSVESLNNLLSDSNYNHQADFVSGVMEKECGEILTSFFQEIRKKRKKNKTGNSL